MVTNWRDKIPVLVQKHYKPSAEPADSLMIMIIVNEAKKTHRVLQSSQLTSGLKSQVPSVRVRVQVNNEDSKLSPSAGQPQQLR